MTASDFDPQLATAQIAAQCRFFEDAYSRADTDGLVDGYFVSDALGPMACPPGRTPPVRGRSALKAMFGGMRTQVDAIGLETIELVLNADQAFEVGRARLTLASGEVSTERYTVCWLNTGEGWRARVDFFATDGWED